MKILIMDDEPLLQQMFKELFENDEVHTASHGVQAIEVLEKNGPFDVALLDIEVERGMNGTEAVIELKKRNKNLKALSVSGYPWRRPEIAHPEKFQFDNSIESPFILEDIINKVKAFG